MTTIGIPYAHGEVTDDGLLKTCPVCGEQILERFDWFDETGEHRGKESGLPDSYAMHYTVEHAGDLS